jgi:deazaflavin-dependent oxidoreductase (nitroreductase family)
MPLQGEYEPSPWDLIADQVTQYESSGGTEGATLDGQACVIVTSRGRRTGKVRKTPLIRVEHEGSYAAVASLGGAPEHPVWFHNLLAHPDEVAVQDGAQVHDLRARQVEGDEKARWWARATAVWPAYDQYQASTDRVIPVVVLEPPAG